MKRKILFCIILAVFILSSPAFAADIILPEGTPVKVCFSPAGNCTQVIVDVLDKAESEILVQAYSFTSAPIAKALLNAYKKGINVAVILDKNQRKERYSSYKFFLNQGIPVFIDDKHAIAHNKVMIIDRETVITGSFNFTKSAEVRNAENLIVIKSKELAREYVRNWEEHRAHSE
ncbi:MAG: phospholipase D family protein [Deltaproteobacteria bacterium]|nr:phospholipase D family protein [Deltaproteobacteria bacterium]